MCTLRLLAGCKYVREGGARDKHTICTCQLVAAAMSAVVNCRRLGGLQLQHLICRPILAVTTQIMARACYAPEGMYTMFQARQVLRAPQQHPPGGHLPVQPQQCAHAACAAAAAACSPPFVHSFRHSTLSAHVDPLLALLLCPEPLCALQKMGKAEEQQGGQYIPK